MNHYLKKQHETLLSSLFLLAALLGWVGPQRATALPGYWLDHIAPPAGRTTQEAQDFLLKRVPPLKTPEDKARWLDQAEALRQELLETTYLQGVPAAWRAPRLGVQWRDSIEHESYIIRKLCYEAVPGLWIPAALYEPRTQTRELPAVLNVNGHSYDQGKAQEVEQIRCITLAQNGLLALHPEWFACGELQQKGYSHASLAYLDAVGIRGVSLFYLAMKRALDLLEDYPRSDPTRLAMTGLSGGGWQTAVLSALDERISVIVPVAGHAGLAPRIEALYDLGDLEQVPSDFLAVADYTHLTALFAPRPTLLIYNQRDECCFLPERALPTTYDAALPVYRLFGAEECCAFYINQHPGTHNYEADNRAQCYRFLETHLLHRPERIHESRSAKEELPPKEALYAGLPEPNETFLSLAQKALATIHRPPVPNSAAPGFTAWQAQQRGLLSEVVRPQTMVFTTALRQSLSKSSPHAFRYELRSADWTINALHLRPAGAKPGSLRIIVADEGVQSLKISLENAVDAHAQVLTFDPLFFGENMPYKQNPDALAMVFDSTGQRLLGVQAGQIMAACIWARSHLQADQITLHCVGWNAGVAGLIAGACLGSDGAPIAGITLEGLPESLTALLTQAISYDDRPALFCYGFLKHFDLPQLIAICAGIPVQRLP